jgi:hypothetical protein
LSILFYSPLILGILVGTYIYLFILSQYYQTSTIWPRTFYRSGWLRCVVVICIGLAFVLVLVLYIIISYTYTIIIIYYKIYYYYILYILYYTLLFYSLSFPLPLNLSSFPFYSSNPLPNTFLSSFQSQPISFILYLSVLTYTYLYYPNLSSILHSSPLLLFFPIYPTIHSILVGTYIYLFIFPPLPNLTPHVLSEWMVEVWCWEWYRVGFWAGGWFSSFSAGDWR